jgi:hypothetical protein
VRRQHHQFRTVAAAAAAPLGRLRARGSAGAQGVAPPPFSFSFSFFSPSCSSRSTAEASSAAARVSGKTAALPPPRAALRHVSEGLIWFGFGEIANSAPPPDHQTTEPSQKVKINRMSERETWLSFLSLRTDVRAQRSCEPCYHLLLASRVRGATPTYINEGPSSPRDWAVVSLPWRMPNWLGPWERCNTYGAAPRHGSTWRRRRRLLHTHTVPLFRQPSAKTHRLSALSQGMCASNQDGGGERRVEGEGPREGEREREHAYTALLVSQYVHP